jgi:thiamine-monophosphate kinase
MDEFSLIHHYLRPLSQGFEGALDLSDDAAVIPSKSGSDIIITKDALSQGIHFIGTESPQHIAQKALRVNLSDLAAMGAEPVAYFLALMLPKNTPHEWVGEFAKGLADDQKQFGVHLAGGDTISTQGPLSFSITAAGYIPSGYALRRNRARAGDIIYMSGTLGDSALGLKLLQKTIGANPSDTSRAFLEKRYLLPEPRIALGRALMGIADAAMDISDGLVQDLGHICKASNVSATIEQAKIPLSPAAAELVENDEKLWETILTGGDDYELLFTAPADKKFAIAALAAELHIPITAIGSVGEGSGVTVLDEAGEPVKLSKAGFKHFA